jgi:nucleoside-diphosphate-sugar epimerase
MVSPTNGDATLLIILGLGFTGRRLARRLLQHGPRETQVFAAVRGIERFRDLAAAGLNLTELSAAESARAEPAPVLPKNAVIAHLIPPLAPAENSALRAMIRKLEPRRIVYVSSTGVYGDQTHVDENTSPEPADERGRLRFEEEQWIASGPWTSLILRAAGIYGPWRGVHAALREGKMPRSSGSGMVSRIHVDDLVALVEAGMFSDLQGAWPVADDMPCSSAEIAAWYLASRSPADVEQLMRNTAIKTSGRSVNGQKIREMLGINLMHPSWKTGLPACLAEEEATTVRE